MATHAHRGLVWVTFERLTGCGVMFHPSRGVALGGRSGLYPGIHGSRPRVLGASVFQVDALGCLMLFGFRGLPRRGGGALGVIAL